MRDLKLVGLSADGRQVVLVDDAGAEFATPADDRLRAALRGDRARLGQLEIEMDSALRPRDIQARIRAGDTPETVAGLAQVPVERIMPYAIPVLAERQHIAELARRSHVRRKGADGPSRALADVVAERLQGRGVDALAAEWDAWRREDGRWAVQASYHSGERERSALFTFDAVGRYSLADDDEAKWLTGERQSTSKGPQPRESGHGGERRLSAVPDGDDLLSLSDDERRDHDSAGVDTGDLTDDLADDLADDLTDDLTAVVRAVRETPQGDRPGRSEPAGDQPSDSDASDLAVDPVPVQRIEEEQESSADAEGMVDEVVADEDVADEVVVAEVVVAEVVLVAEAAAAPHGAEAPDGVEASGAAAIPGASRGPADAPTEPTPERKRRSKRASVPSWDEIMFGKDDG